ncbi:MAG: CRISPR system precrRNA processing endoribonuclease RAMP protein Cas6 [Anaerolineae bacterium]|nr:CRISPR system precrRNA processing endoribonuclease RAMP protein Cas6 [Anaerolineae bacterium]
MILEDLPLLRLRVDLTSLDTLEVPPYKGDLLRMALLWWLSEFWCPEERRCRDGCRRPDVCMFGRLCTPQVNPAWSEPLRRLMGDTPPPAYTLWDLRDRRTMFEAGDDWAFEMTWAGALAIQQLPALIAALQRGAEQGMGRIRWRNQIRQITAWVPTPESSWRAHPLAELGTLSGQPALIWQGPQLAELRFDYRQAASWAAIYSAPLRALQLDYLSPVKMKERGEWVVAPAFDAVARSVVRRLRILSEVYGGGEWPQSEYGPLLDLAETVTLQHHETHWLGYTRRSRRAGRYEVEGFAGPAWYAAEDFRPLLPVLWLGQWLHLGKGYVLGNGRYEIRE